MRATIFAGAALAGLLATAPAWADLHELRGERLVITTGGADVVFQTEDGRGGKVTLETSDSDCAHGNDAGGTVTIEAAGCSGTVHITVPRHFPVTISSAGEGDIQLAPDLGPLVATLTASGGLNGGQVDSLTLGIHGDGDARVQQVNGPARVSITGSGDARLGHVNGPLNIDIHGSGDVVVGSISSQQAQVSSDGSGDILIGAGDIHTLSAHMHGSGNLSAAAQVQDAELQASGGSDIKLARVTGNVSRDASEGGSIKLDESGLEAMVLAKISDVVADADAHANNPVVINLHTHHHHGDGDSTSSSGHFFSTIIVLIIAWMVFSTLRKNGAFARMQTRFGGAPAQAAPMHPGVAAVRASLGRLEDRLAKVEGYVTSREFDLQQKFRDLEK